MLRFTKALGLLQLQYQKKGSGIYRFKMILRYDFQIVREIVGYVEYTHLQDVGTTHYCDILEDYWVCAHKGKASFFRGF